MTRRKLPSSKIFLANSSLLILQRLPRPTLFPYTTLFRSRSGRFIGPSGVKHLCAEGASNGDIPHLGHSRPDGRSEEHTSELQSQSNLVCRLLLDNQRIDNFLEGKPCANESLIPYCRFLLRDDEAKTAILENFLSKLFSFNSTATSKTYTLSLHDALPISFWPIHWPIWGETPMRRGSVEWRYPPSGSLPPRR